MFDDSFHCPDFEFVPPCSNDYSYGFRTIGQVGLSFPSCGGRFGGEIRLLLSSSNTEQSLEYVVVSIIFEIVPVDMISACCLASYKLQQASRFQLLSEEYLDVLERSGLHSFARNGRSAPAMPDSRVLWVPEPRFSTQN